MLSEEIIRYLKEDTRFQQFAEHALGIIESADTVVDLGDMPTYRAGEEAKARSLAKKMVMTIFRPVLAYNEKPEVTEEQRRKAASDVGL